jgi:hypothetical protein
MRKSGGDSLTRVYGNWSPYGPWDRKFNNKYGASSWNEGMIMTDQTDVPEGYKRCSKQVDPRCKERHGIIPLEDYYKRGGSVKGAWKYRAHCKYCDSYMAYQRTREKGRIEDYRRYQREYKRKKHMAVNHKPVRILKDPTKMFKPGAEFSKHDFRESLDGGVWPRGMEVLDVETETVYIILGTRMVHKEVTENEK